METVILSDQKSVHFPVLPCSQIQFIRLKVRAVQSEQRPGDRKFNDSLMDNYRRQLLWRQTCVEGRQWWIIETATIAALWRMQHWQNSVAWFDWWESLVRWWGTCVWWEVDMMCDVWWHLTPNSGLSSVTPTGTGKPHSTDRNNMKL